MFWLLLTAGRGPTECQRFLHHLLVHLQNECRQNGLPYDLLRSEHGLRKETLKSALLGLSKHGASDFVNEIKGTHKWICQSPFRPKHKRKNWFVAIKLFTEPERFSWDASEVRIETFRSSGPGGQHANKSNSAVRVTHIPTAVTATAQEERSQYQNKRLALVRLHESLKHAERQRDSRIDQSLWLQGIEVERGNPVRTYEGQHFRQKR